MSGKRPPPTLPAGLARWREQIKQASKMSERFGMGGRVPTHVSEKLRISDKTKEELFGPIRRALRGDGEQPAAPKTKAKRKPGAGMKRLLSDKKIVEGKKVYRQMLREDRRWANAKQASAMEVKNRLNLGPSWFTVKRYIVNPVLAERKAQRSRRAK